ncbi:hypothetical protein EDB81DRAFT_447949 [Dactylonectria macrodidyma]|uniref:Protein kinase domain-containing protein n=1 Tax=Dactylonectria macrodidyma TaxID=307937 RepID=A0A9P9F4U7_9HYPO|nr:hypothetical protein EDB81DRAFT_447949 [Dactylonectria macrodidyma]
MPFHYEDYSGTDLDVIQRLSPAHYLDQYRNERAVQSAILRGDEEVILTNTSTLAGLKEPRYVHPPYIHQRNPYEVKFRELRSPESEDGLTENDIRERLDREWKGFRLEFLKILGTGGLGSGTLWKVHLEGGVTKQVVIKVPKTEESYSEEESEWHKRYEGSRHTVQYVDLAKMASDARDAYKAKYPDMPCQYDRGSDFISDEATGMPLEFMSRGDLFRIMKTASTKRLKRFPDKALWGIWECLVKGAAAMAYQPRANKWNIVFENDMEKAEANGDLERFFEFLEAEPITHDIHLDLEESNILAGEDSAHPEQPVFKMHDFGGFSFAMNEAWGHRDEKFYWSRRKPTKMTRLTPEQVHQDWDTLRNNLPGREAVERFEGSDLTKGNPIAGRYGVWTNIFILAKTMEAVITQLYFVHPFTSDDYETMDGKSGRTYGWRLNEPEFDFVDPELRDILCECLFERPIDRPSILDLLRNIEARKKRGFPEQLGDLKWFWRKVFGPFATKPVRASAVPDAELDLEEVIRTNVMSSAERDARIYGDELDLEEIVRANRKGPIP